MKERELEQHPVCMLVAMATLAVAGLLVVDVYLQRLDVHPAPQAEQMAPTGPVVRTPARVQDTIRLCDPGYPGPDGKDDCERAKKLLANPQYIKQM